MTRGRKALIKMIVECQGPKDKEKRIFMDTPRNVAHIIKKTKSQVFRFLTINKEEIAAIELKNGDERDIEMGTLLDNCSETQKLEPVQQGSDFAKFYNGIPPKINFDPD